VHDVVTFRLPMANALRGSTRVSCGSRPSRSQRQRATSRVRRARSPGPPKMTDSLARGP